MTILYMLSWWYSRGFGYVLMRISDQLKAINNTLAVDTLLSTLFAPWKQITNAGTVGNFMQRALDNLVSRLIGFFVRFFMLIFGGLWAVCVLIIGVVWLVFWPFIPLLVFILPILAIKGVTL